MAFDVLFWLVCIRAHERFTFAIIFYLILRRLMALNAHELAEVAFNAAITLWIRLWDLNQLWIASELLIRSIFLAVCFGRNRLFESGGWKGSICCEQFGCHLSEGFIRSNSTPHDTHFSWRLIASIVRFKLHLDAQTLRSGLRRLAALRNRVDLLDHGNDVSISNLWRNQWSLPMRCGKHKTLNNKKLFWNQILFW